YLLLPVVAAAPVLRTRSFVQATIVACWFAVLSTVGAGLSGLFKLGLMSQQVGVLVFTLFVWNVIAVRRLDRAAIWLGLIPLLHVHTSIVSAFVWIVAAAVAAIDRETRRTAIGCWIRSSFIAAMIASPTLLGLFQGWQQIGASTYFPIHHEIVSQLSWYLAPWPAIFAILLSVACSLLLATRERVENIIWTLVA